MLAYSCGGAAHAQADIFSPETLHGVAEVRLAVADGERSWLDGGFGKTAISGGGGWKANAAVSQAALEWRPKLNFAVGAVVTAGVQADVHPMVDIGEAFLTLQAPPTAAGRPRSPTSTATARPTSAPRAASATSCSTARSSSIRP